MAIAPTTSTTMMLALGRTGLSLAIAALGFLVLALGMVILAPWGLVGMATKYSEALLSVKYRIVDPSGGGSS